jgi:hypothetical protein
VARVKTLFAVDKGGRVAIDAPRLPPNAAVVVRGNERLYPTAAIAPTPAAAAAPPTR